MKHNQRMRSLWSGLILFISLPFSAVFASESPNSVTLSNELEQIKKQVIELNRDLFILEEDLLFPASTQVAVFISVDIGKFFSLDSVELKIDDQDVAGTLYTERQRKALEQGGIQQLYIGNIKSGEHRLTAFFTGVDNQGRTIKKAVNYKFDKDDDAKMLELSVHDNEADYRADFHVEEWMQ